MAAGIPVLMYHALQGGGQEYNFNDPGEYRYVIDVKDFRQQIEFLKNKGYHSISLQDAAGSAETSEKNIIITFDDGHESNFTLALPILQEFGFKATFFITTGWIGRPDFLNTEQIQALENAGMTIGSHGVTHSYFNDLDSSSLYMELQESAKQLEEITKKAINSLSAPGGRIDERTLKAGEEIGYSLFCTSTFGLWSNLAETRNIPRIAVKRGMPFSHFVKLVNGDPILFAKIGIRTSLLGFLKRLLGNHMYDRLWRKVHTAF